MCARPNNLAFHPNPSSGQSSKVAEKNALPQTLEYLSSGGSIPSRDNQLAKKDVGGPDPRRGDTLRSRQLRRHKPRLGSDQIRGLAQSCAWRIAGQARTKRKTGSKTQDTSAGTDRGRKGRSSKERARAFFGLRRPRKVGVGGAWRESLGQKGPIKGPARWAKEILGKEREGPRG